VLGRRFLLSVVVALSLSTLAPANSTTVNMTSLYLGTKVSGGDHAFPYYLSINGGKVTPSMKHALASEFKGLVLYTPVVGSPGPGPRPQEFIGYRGTPAATPEPANLILLSTGLIGIAGLMRRKLRS